MAQQFLRAVADRLSALGGGCSAPVAAYAHWVDGELQMTGLVGSTDGSRIIRVEGRGSDAATLGIELGEQAIRDGAQELLRHV